MFSFLTDLEINVVIGVVAFVAGLSPLGTKVVDFFKGVPAELRTALNGVEATATASVAASVKSAKASVISQLPIPAPKAPPPPAAPVPAVTAAVSAPAAPAA